jgi:hypothetical protein
VLNEASIATHSSIHVVIGQKRAVAGSNIPKRISDHRWPGSCTNPNFEHEHIVDPHDLKGEGERDPIRLQDGALERLLPATTWREAS